VPPETGESAEIADPPATDAPDAEAVDEESLTAYVDNLSPSESKRLYEMLKSRYESDGENRKLTLKDIIGEE